jgi:enamine deaminase RidA (YjgF/YER057c/UK114 family)
LFRIIGFLKIHSGRIEGIMSIEARIQELGLTLPDAPAAAGTYSPVVIVDKMAYVSGQGPIGADGRLLTGKVGDDLSEEEGVAAARAVGLTMLATIKAQLGSLDRVKRIIKVLGMVNSTPDFKTHPKVINGFSDLMVEIWGEEGRAARSAVGMGSLPGNIPVEIEAILELND